MEFKPTLFSIVGFLFPGMVSLASLTVLVGRHHYGSFHGIVAAVPQLPDGTAVPIGTLLVLSTLATTFVAGSVLSDTFTYIGRQLVLRPWVRDALRSNAKRVFAHKTLEELLLADMDARESCVYMNTGGLDLDWYAGRVRMMGGTGLGLLVNAGVAGVLGFSWIVYVTFLVTAAWAIGIALYRSKKFDEYVLATSAVIARGGAEHKKT